MTELLETWLKQATRCLSKDAAAQVRAEIHDHYESERETALARGITAAEADLFAVTALGDAKTANRQYRSVLLTTGEARMLRDARWEGKVVCSRRWIKWLLLATPVAAILASAAAFLVGSLPIARVLLAGGIGIGYMFVGPYLPIYTPARARIYRRVKWVVLFATFAVAFGIGTNKLSWLMASCIWPLIWIEWTRVSIRRKLPVAQWPRQLYL